MTRKRKLILFLLISFLTVVTFIYKANTAVDKMAESCYSNVSAIPSNKVGLVLGTSKKVSNGTNNAFFTYRIRAATELYKAGKVKYFIVSGDNGHSSYNEPRDMLEALVKAGIPKANVFMDYAGFRTLDSVVRSKKVFGCNDVTIISQPFHNERALYIAKHYGINAVGFNAQDVLTMRGKKTILREYLARVKMMLDLYLLNTGPKYLGEPIAIPT